MGISRRLWEGTLLKGEEPMKAICGLLLAGVIATGVRAQESAEKKNTQDSSKQPVASGANDQSTSVQPNKGISLIGKTVFDEKGRQIGRIQDLAADLEHGEIGYAVIAVNSGDESARKLPVPVRALKAGKDENSLVLNVSEKVLVALEVYRDEELPAADAFRPDASIGAPAASEKGAASSSDQSKDTKAAPKPEQKAEQK
jgi:sporulation protein YlmC with PRC-barrel domain